MLSRNLLVAVSVLLLIQGIVLLRPTTVNAYVTSEIEGMLDLGVERARQWDASCRNHLSSNRNSSARLRTIINTGASYAPSTWLSERNKPNTVSPTFTDYAAQTVPLQINSVTFLCGSLVVNDRYGTTNAVNGGVAANPEAGVLADEGVRWVGDGEPRSSPGYARDRPPNARGRTNQLPALVSSKSTIVRFQILQGGGEIRGGTGGELRLGRNEGSRYWFAPSVPVDYFDANGITQEKTVVVRMFYKQIAGYHAYSGNEREELCEGPSGIVSTNGLDTLQYSSCKELYQDLIILVKPNPPPVAVVEGRKVMRSGAENSEFSYTDRVSIDTDGDGTGEQGTPNSPFRWEEINTSNTVRAHAANSVPNGWKVIGSVFCDRNTPNGTNECDQMTKNPTGWGGYLGGLGRFQSVSGTGTKIREIGVLTGNHTYKFLWIYEKDSTPIDLCNNIAGIQTTVPAGLTRNSDGDCVALPATICSGTALRNAPINRSSPWADSYNETTTTFVRITYQYVRTEVQPTGTDEWGQSAQVYYAESTTNPAQIDYTNFARDYPYDFHTGNVDYRVVFNRKTVSGTKVNGDFVVQESNSTRSVDRNTSAAQMSPCYNRLFDLVPVASQASLNDEERPTSVTLTGRLDGGYLRADQYGIGIRTNSRVTSAVNGVYYTRDLNDTIVSGNTAFTYGNETITGSGLSTNFVNFNNNTYTDSFTVSRPPLNFGDKICFYVSLPQATGNMNQAGVIQPGATSKQSAEACTSRVGDKPYFRVYGGDIAAGGSFQNNGVCAAPTSGSIIGHYRNGTTAGSGGAATGLAAIGLNVVEGVASASQRTSGAPSLPNGLTFGNSGSGVPVNVANIQFGGNYGKAHCAPDYYNVEQFNDGDPRKNTSPTSGVINFAAATFADGGQSIYSTPGTTKEINSPAKISKRHTVFVNGDVVIRKNIEYETANWTDERAIPYIAIIAKGNIYIEAGVSELNGLFIAQPGNGQPGRIYTCKEWDDFNRGAMAVERCRAPLKINGAFIAQQVVLQRTTGTVSTSPGPQEPKTSPNIAEVFNFTPEFYIGKPVFKPKATKYDSIRDLPPVL